MLASELKEESELSLLRKEAAQLRTQLAEVKRVDDQELDKLWRLAGRTRLLFCSCCISQLLTDVD